MKYAQNNALKNKKKLDRVLYHRAQFLMDVLEFAEKVCGYYEDSEVVLHPTELRGFEWIDCDFRRGGVVDADKAGVTVQWYYAGEVMEERIPYSYINDTYDDLAKKFNRVLLKYIRQD